MKLSDKAKKLIGYSAIGLILILFPILVGGSEFYLNTLVYIGIFLILAIGFQFLFQCGILNIGHPAFMGVGAYASASMTNILGLSFWLALPVAGIVPSLFAGLIGYLTLRVGRGAFFMISLSFLNLFQLIMRSYGTGYFGGSNGMRGIPHPSISLPGLSPMLLESGVEYYYLTLVIVLITLFVIYSTEKSRFGKAIMAIGDSVELAASVGINTLRFKTIAFMIACFFAGIAGSLYAHYMTIITPLDFGIDQSLTMQVYAWVGGVSSVFGPIIGGLLLGTIGMFTMDLERWEPLIYGILLVIIIIRSPGGLWGIVQKIRGEEVYVRGILRQ